MSKLQIILISETSTDDKSDIIYIRSTIDKYFNYESDVYDGEVATIPFFLHGKQNYCDKRILSRIKSQARMFACYNPGAITVVIYFMDTDSVKKEYKEGSFFYNVKDFCKNNGFELAWFCKNAENVFLKKESSQVASKTESAKDFAFNDGINRINKSDLMDPEINQGHSNILLILSKYLKWK